MKIYTIVEEYQNNGSHWEINKEAYYSTREKARQALKEYLTYTYDEEDIEFPKTDEEWDEVYMPETNRYWATTYSIYECELDLPMEDQ